VHCAAVGMFKTLQKSKKRTAPLPEKDHRYMLDIVTSAFRPSKVCYVMLTPMFRCDCQHTVSILDACPSCSYVIVFKS
jgi:hypothetical protein